jgi:hypothetical protein
MTKHVTGNFNPILRLVWFDLWSIRPSPNDYLSLALCSHLTFYYYIGGIFCDHITSSESHKEHYYLRPKNISRFSS